MKRYFIRPQMQLQQAGYVVATGSSSDYYSKATNGKGLTMRTAAIMVVALALPMCGCSREARTSPELSTTSQPTVAEPTFRGRSLRDWKARLNDRDANTQLEAALAVAKLDPKDGQASAVLRSHMETDVLPLAMRTARAQPLNGIVIQREINRVIPADPWGNKLSFGGISGTGEGPRRRSLPQGPDVYCYVLSQGPDGEAHTDDDMTLFWDEAGESYFRVGNFYK